MHQLFSLVLGQRDLSRAGDLFSLEDVDIEDCLSQALDQIKAISCSADYLTSDNDQAVVEICITRITTAIRETGSIERHSTALVALWESCLEHNLTPQRESTEDTPHAKIASDITSCILQNYSCPSVMALAVPVAVRFLQRGNKELSRNMSSYLSLAAIAKADLLSDHAEAITLSVLGGNHMLLRVLPSIYPRQPDVLHRHLGNLTDMMPRLQPPEQQHLLRLIQMVAEQHPLMLSPHVPALVSYLLDQSLAEALLGTLVDVSQASPSSLVSFLPALRVMAHQCPNFLGHISKMYGAVGIINESQAHSSLVFLVSLLGSLEHSFHHTVLQEIRALSDRYPLLLGGCGKDIYRMSNSFTAMARVLGKRLEDNATEPKGHSPFPCGSSPGPGQQLEVNVQGFGVKPGSEVTEGGDTPGPQRRYSLSQALRDERHEMRFNRSKSLALHIVRSRSISSDTGEDSTDPELHLDTVCLLSSDSGAEATLSSENTSTPGNQDSLQSPEVTKVTEATGRDMCEAVTGQSTEDEAPKDEPEKDRLFIHLRDNMDLIREFCQDTMRRIPIPEECSIEDSNRGCVAKLSFSCPLKGHYCLYTKSCFSLTSRQPHQWIHIMLLHLQSMSNAPLCSKHECVQRLAALWEKTKLKGAHSFTLAMTQHSTLHRKDLDSLQTQLEEVRFFDLFGFSEEHRGWLCFMCNNPEKATVVNQDGQPLIEGKLKEKQIRWRFIKRWKTRYFTLAGNQLLFRKGSKSKDEMDDIPIELSKVQSVKVVARKRRDRGLPRAFEIFTDSKTYVLKAQDEKHAEEWLQCINVAVAQARERENREATTYL
uniref:PH domain-containing protein n=1 Tax=Periophthalmus magnuspinnatus TaxID=409849 RepID=A0A3B4AS82_9GOBI